MIFNAPLPRSLALASAITASALSLGCASAASPQPPPIPGSIDAVATELQALAGSAIPAHPETFRAILETSLASDPYVCLPSPRDVFWGYAQEGERVIQGAMPHYGFFLGPMHYLIRRRGTGRQGRWEVDVRMAVDLPAEGGELELADCNHPEDFEGSLVCQGIPYAQSGKREPCPGSGTFRAPATRRNMKALLQRWSMDAEEFYNRDAKAFGLPIRYDFHLMPRQQAEAAAERIDLTLPLVKTCGRTPYFSSVRSAWSMPVVAHEIGHLMGLLDEYEMFSGIVSCYPKTPFPGAEISRMGLSMFENTLVLPLHHYLILRRYFCPDPSTNDPYVHALP